MGLKFKAFVTAILAFSVNVHADELDCTFSVRDLQLTKPFYVTMTAKTIAGDLVQSSPKAILATGNTTVNLSDKNFTAIGKAFQASIQNICISDMQPVLKELSTLKNIHSFKNDDRVEQMNREIMSKYRVCVNLIERSLPKTGYANQDPRYPKYSIYLMVEHFYYKDIRLPVKNGAMRSIRIADWEHDVLSTGLDEVVQYLLGMDSRELGKGLIKLELNFQIGARHLNWGKVINSPDVTRTLLLTQALAEDGVSFRGLLKGDYYEKIYAETFYSLELFNENLHDDPSKIDLNVSCVPK